MIKAGQATSVIMQNRIQPLDDPDSTSRIPQNSRRNYSPFLDSRNIPFVAWATCKRLSILDRAYTHTHTHNRDDTHTGTHGKYTQKFKKKKKKQAASANCDV